MRYPQKVRKNKFKKYPRETVSYYFNRIKYRHMKRYTAAKCNSIRWWCPCCKPSAFGYHGMSSIQRAYDKREVRKLIEEYET